MKPVHIAMLLGVLGTAGAWAQGVSLTDSGTSTNILVVPRNTAATGRVFAGPESYNLAASTGFTLTKFCQEQYELTRREAALANAFEIGPEAIAADDAAFSWVVDTDTKFVIGCRKKLK